MSENTQEKKIVDKDMPNEEIKIKDKKHEEVKQPVSKMNFAEYKLNLKPELSAALKVYADVKHDMEEKTKEEWDSLFDKMQNRKIG